MPPLISILLPTRNRPQLVQDAITSVLLQEVDYGDCELIVSNNGDTQIPRLRHRRHDKIPVRYIAPQEYFSMPKHWEWASQYAEGKYLLVLADRNLLRNNALRTLQRHICENDYPEVLSWPVLPYYPSGLFIKPHSVQQNTTTFNCKQILEMIRTEQMIFNHILPRGHNSCVRSDVMASVRKQKPVFFDAINPDFSSAFAILCTAKELLYSNDYLAIGHGMNVSNGGLHRRGIDTGYMKEIGAIGKLTHIPIDDRYRCYIAATMFEDYLRVMEAFDTGITWQEVNPVAFYRACLNELVVWHAFDYPWNSPLRELRQQFVDSVRREGSERASMVWKSLLPRQQLRDFISLGVDHWLSPRLKSAVRDRLHLLLGTGCRYPNALEAADFAPGARELVCEGNC